MKMMRNTLEKVTKELLIEPLLNLMTEQVEDFEEETKAYKNALITLEKELPIEELEEAIFQLTASIVLFSGWLGFKANMDHFADPIAQNFLEVDAETYLQEHVLQQMPRHKKAQETLHNILSRLPQEREEMYEKIVEYISHLETILPKFAHYYGYILGNELLPNILPGYAEDTKMTAKYERILREYMGIFADLPSTLNLQNGSKNMPF